MSTTTTRHQPWSGVTCRHCHQRIEPYRPRGFGVINATAIAAIAFVLLLTWAWQMPMLVWLALAMTGIPFVPTPKSYHACPACHLRLD